mmetsp:Transcript_79320/g.222682  ORF Transcript_79320/g.222682 Transcript_79320/m.222682 type:complete len:478 (-) Transcript_79320:118-1551(-)
MSRDLLGPGVANTPHLQAHGGDKVGLSPIDEIDVSVQLQGEHTKGTLKSGYTNLIIHGRIEGAPGSNTPSVKGFSRSESGLSKQSKQSPGGPVGGQFSLGSGMSKATGSGGIKRSSSSGSIISKASTPQWARPVLRRAYSHGSTNTDRSVQSSAISGLELHELREERSMKVDYKTPCSVAYNVKEKCGEGGFGTVWKCQKVGGSEQMFAVKCTKVKEEKDMLRTIRELKAFERFTHPNLVTLHEVFLDQEHLYMVMDLCLGGDLHQYLTAYTDDASRLARRMDFPDSIIGLPTRVVACLLWQMLAGIAYMHHHRFCHRDIKLQNYVIQEPAEYPSLQLVDFGMAIRFRRGVAITGTMGTVKYMAPEVLKGPYNENCDTWSIGVCTYILSTSRSPWGTKKSNQTLAICIVENQREQWPACDKPMALRSLIESMMNRKVEARPSAKHLLKHSKWLKKNGLMKQVPESHKGSKGSCCTIS